jgi:hypothetical protein
MDQLPVFHRHAIVCQSAIEAGPEEMVRAAASMLSTAVAITKRMPVIQRALFVEQIFKEARKLLGSYTDNEQMETRH